MNYCKIVIMTRRGNTVRATNITGLSLMAVAIFLFVLFLYASNS